MADIVGKIHSGYIAGKRATVLSTMLSDLLPRRGDVLDIGCGDGFVDYRISQLRDGLCIRGIDVIPREKCFVPVEYFDGELVPYDDGCFDSVMFVDVLHHTQNPSALLGEARRLARRSVLIKDHTLKGVFARQTLQFMDRVGNASADIALPYNYWTEEQWRETISSMGFTVEKWQSKLKLYPPPAGWLFNRSLHFVAALGV